jgi:hypothetical protein
MLQLLKIGKNRQVWRKQYALIKRFCKGYLLCLWKIVLILSVKMFIFIDYSSDSCGNAVCSKVCGEISLHLKCLHFHVMSLFRIGLKWIH